MNPLHCFLNLFITSFFLFLFACSSSDDAAEKTPQHRYQKGEFIYRKHNEHLFTIPAAEPKTIEPYPWEQNLIGQHLKITKDFFRCKGSILNPVRIVENSGEMVRFYDCGGASKHSLPLRENKEFIYPILIELLNYLQTKTNHRVVITSGHRCPEHNAYVDSSKDNMYSKHMIGAEASFYVQGLEDKPEVVIQWIQQYFKDVGRESEFKRYEKEDNGGISTKPWFNKEIFLKLFRKQEGRNFDNRHPYPYLSIQVRFDYTTQEKIQYSWDKATQNYLRH